MTIAKIRTALEGVDEAKYRADWRVQDITERNLQTASQIVLDTGSHIIAEMGWESPENYEQVIAILARYKVISPELAQRLRGMAGFRNVLVHEYLDIDDGKVYEAGAEHLDDYVDFAASVAAWVESNA